MKKNFALQLRDLALHGPWGSVELLREPFNGNAVDKTAPNNLAAPEAVDVLIDHLPRVAVPVNHFFAFTRPEPLQVGHFL